MENVGYRVSFRKTEERFDELWGLKARVRESVHDWLAASNVRLSISEVCANACSELLENCIKFTRNKSVAAISVSLTEQIIVVETINSTHGLHVEVLRQSLDALRAASDPQQLFINALLNSVEGQSRLGLIKIILETRGTLELVPQEEQEIVHLKLRVQQR